MGRVWPSFLAPTNLGRLAPLALGAAPLTREPRPRHATAAAALAQAASATSATAAQASTTLAALVAYVIAAAAAQAASLAACASVSLAAQAASPLPLARWSSSLSQTSSCPLLRSGFGTSTSGPYSFGASRCSLMHSMAHGRRAPFALVALVARLSCSLVLFGSLRPSPSLLLPTVLGYLAPLSPVAALLTRGAAASTAARDDGSSVGASGVGGVWRRRRIRRRHRQRMRRWRRVRLRKRRRRLLRTRRIRRRRWRPKPLLLYH